MMDHRLLHSLFITNVMLLFVLCTYAIIAHPVKE